MPASPPVPAVLVVAGTDHHAMVAEVLGVDVPTPQALAYLVLRGGPAGGAAFIPGHREPREVTIAGNAAGPPTRPPRRLELRRPLDLLSHVELVVAPAGPASPAGTEILADALSRADGLVYVLDATAPLSPERRDELSAAVAVGVPVAIVYVRDATPDERAVIHRQVPAIEAATWVAPADLADLCAAWPVPCDAADPAVATPVGARAVPATDDDVRWRATLDRELRTRSSALRQRLGADLAALETRCATEPGGLPVALDAELHALSLRTTKAVDRAAQAIVRSVFSQVVTGRLTETVVARVVAALAEQVAEPERTLLVTATAGVASVPGSAVTLSATRGVAPTLLPPIAVAVSGNCHLMWHYRGVPDKTEARRWLHQAVQTLERDLTRALDDRFTLLGEAVGALAAETVDHGVLLT